MVLTFSSKNFSRNRFNTKTEMLKKRNKNKRKRSNSWVRSNIATVFLHAGEVPQFGWMPS
jgi:hypothetical protein